MEQHPIPRQITSFEFKLVGFLTIKQFIYIVIFIGIGFVVYLIFPVPILNVLLGLVAAGMGAALAFLPVNDRPLDVWIRNLFKRLMSPTQYIFKKNNPPPAFLKNMSTTASPHTSSHIDSQKKLNNYVGGKNTATANTKKQTINDLMSNSLSALSGKKPAPKEVPTQPQSSPQQTPPHINTPKKPFFTGLIKNHKQTPLYGILIYVKGQNAAPLRILKTNVNGVFATFNPLPKGEYSFEIKDPQGIYIFDTMKVTIADSNPHPFEVVSNELI
jgi:hypothetical protein